VDNTAAENGHSGVRCAEDDDLRSNESAAPERAEPAVAEDAETVTAAYDDLLTFGWCLYPALVTSPTATRRWLAPDGLRVLPEDLALAEVAKQLEEPA
jgi:hypothetical protein